MPSELSPIAAAKLATSAYVPHANTGASGNTQRRLVRDAAQSVAPGLDYGGMTLLEGVTGPGVRAPFGFVAHGTSGSWAGDTVVCIRGTSSVPDWLTNVYFPRANGPSGHAVHKGFNGLAGSLVPQIRSAMRGRNPSRIHVIGHSLGGAAATLVAESIHGMGGTKLYTFGAPRAGTWPHSSHVTNAIGADNIYRAYHDTDIVPMVPIFPYTHNPAGQTAYLLTGHGHILSIHTHLMPQYEGSMTSSWRSLPVISHRRFSLDTVDDVLKEAGHIPNGFLSSLLLRLLTRALQLILRAAGGVVGLAAFGAFTIIDQLVVAMQRLARMGAAAAEQVMELVRQIARFLGITLREGGNITAQFLRWIIDRLVQTIVNMAAAAVRGLS